MSQLLSTKDLCEKLKVSRTTIENWRKEGMPFSKLGKIVRFNETDVIEWLENKGDKK